MSGPDEELARRTQRGDQGAFMELAHRYQHVLYRLAYRFAGTAEDADDLCQECLVRAYRQIGKYDERRPFLPWLMRLSTNVCINFSRSRTRLRDTEEPWHERYDAPLAGDAECEAIDRIERKEVLQALQDLDGETRVLVIMRFVLGYTFREIAERTGMKLPTVAFRISRGVEALRGALRREPEAVE